MRVSEERARIKGSQSQASLSAEARGASGRSRHNVGRRGAEAVWCTHMSEAIAVLSVTAHKGAACRDGDESCCCCAGAAPSHLLPPGTTKACALASRAAASRRIFMGFCSYSEGSSSRRRRDQPVFDRVLPPASLESKPREEAKHAGTSERRRQEGTRPRLHHLPWAQMASAQPPPAQPPSPPLSPPAPDHPPLTLATLPDDALSL
jgi:hypothetical protein